MGKFHGVDDFVVLRPCLRMGGTALLAIVPLAPQGFPFAACSLESKKCATKRTIRG